MHNPFKDDFVNHIRELQDTLCQAFEKEESARFVEETWKRPGGGGGISRVLTDGAHLEKAGISTSLVHGELPETFKAHFKTQSTEFMATGLSLVLHPRNPFCPTVHANWRYFEMYNAQGECTDFWYGGGTDLTPYYMDEIGFRHFHGVLKSAVDATDTTWYSDLKSKCDSYFYNHHREEARGIGGIFYDYLRPDAMHDTESVHMFAKSMGNCFLDAYLPIFQRRKDLSYTKEQETWHRIRRGRYVEFNLLHDKGTLFGIKTNGRTESILMSLPPVVYWEYNVHPEIGSPEAEMLEILKHPTEWT